MEVRSMPQPILKAGVEILAPYVPQLTASGLVRALKAFEAGAPAPIEPWWPVQKTAEFLSETHWSTIRRLKSGALRGRRVGGKWLVDPASVRELLGIGGDTDCRGQAGASSRDGRYKE